MARIESDMEAVMPETERGEGRNTCHATWAQDVSVLEDPCLALDLKWELTWCLCESKLPFGFSNYCAWSKRKISKEKFTAFCERVREDTLLKGQPHAIQIRNGQLMIAIASNADAQHRIRNEIGDSPMHARAPGSQY